MYIWKAVEAKRDHKTEGSNNVLHLGPSVAGSTTGVRRHDGNQKRNRQERAGGIGEKAIALP